MYSHVYVSLYHRYQRISYQDVLHLRTNSFNHTKKFITQKINYCMHSAQLIHFTLTEIKTLA